MSSVPATMSARPAPERAVSFSPNTRREAHGHEDAQLVYGHHDAGQAVLERLVVAEPRGARGQAGEADEEKLAAGNGADRACLARHVDHDPGHDQHHDGPDGRAQVGLHALDTHLAQNGRQAGKHRGEHGKHQPGASCGRGARRSRVCRRGRLALDHHQRAGEDERHGDDACPAQGLAQQQEGKEHGEDGAGLVDGHDLVDVSKLERLEVAQPRGTRSQAGEAQERPVHRRNRANLPRRARHRDHDPGKRQDNDGPDGGGNRRVGLADAALGQDGRDSRKERRPARKRNPHGKASEPKIAPRAAIQHSPRA